MTQLVSSIVSEPSVEPVTLLEAKQHLHLDTDEFSESMSSTIVIDPATYSAATVTSTPVDISGTQAFISLSVGTAAGTITAILQDSSSSAGTYADSGSSQVISAANDHASFTFFYSGVKSWVRLSAVVASDVCEFSADMIQQTPANDEDTRITTLISVARKQIEKACNRSLITQTWDFYWPSWPAQMNLWRGPLQSITGVFYTDEDSVETEVTSSVYVADILHRGGRVVLANNQSWPTSDTYAEVNAIRTRAVVGFGDAGSDVPVELRQAMLLIIEDLFWGTSKNMEAIRLLIQSNKVIC
jgi:uncharacterized phiE125 gp8 family phage protein